MFCIVIQLALVRARRGAALRFGRRGASASRSATLFARRASSPSARRHLVAAGLAFFGTGVPAQEAPAVDAALVEQVRSLALTVPQPGSPRVEVVVGQLDPRLHLAPCQRIEPYLPAGVRLWGKSRIGLRCAQGAVAWNVYLPVTVKVFGRALVVPAGAAAGSTLVPADLVEEEVDLAEDATPAVTDSKLAVGRVLAQALKPGQTVRQGQLKVRQWFAAGETVRVVALGDGFSLESEGQALGNGLEGQAVRVRTENGRVVTGMPTGERRLEVSL